MLYNSSNTQNTVTSVPAITYVFVGLTSFVLAYFTAMDKGGDSESLPKDESVTSMLPGLGATASEAENEQEEGDEKPNDEASTTESETEPDQSTYESESKPAPVTGGKKRKKSIKKQIKKTTSKRSTKSRST